MGLTGDEPNLALGDSGEHVAELQSRLRGLGLFVGLPEGSYDGATEDAVRQLQSLLGQSNDGTVSADTWRALDEYMVNSGLEYYPAAGPMGQAWEQAPADAAASAAAPEADAFVPHFDDVHPGIQEDDRFSTFHDFLRAQPGAQP
jgi:peptidoglycan hydrolase-like protein with peptidoglycan-binding domain